MNPALYAALHQGYTEDLDFWLSLARHADGPVLELGCGTGRVLLPLLRADVPVWGVDRDLAMLIYLRQHTPVSLRPRLRLICADITQLALQQRFACILLPCNTWSTFPPSTLRQIAHRIAQHLLPGGCFALSSPNPTWIAQLPPEGASEPEAVLQDPQTGLPVQVSSAWQRTDDRWIVLWHYDQLSPDGSVTRSTVRQTHYLIPPDRQAALLRSAGLTLEARYGSFTGAPWTVESPYLIWIWRRNEPPTQGARKRCW